VKPVVHARVAVVTHGRFSIYALSTRIGAIKGDKAIIKATPEPPRELRSMKASINPGTITRKESWPTKVDDVLTSGVNDPKRRPREATAVKDKKVERRSIPIVNGSISEVRAPKENMPPPEVLVMLDVKEFIEVKRE
jgi:hypothetical protein